MDVIKKIEKRWPRKWGLNLVIEILSGNRGKEKLLPQNVATYEDVRLFVSRYIGFWTTAFRDSVPEDDPKNLERFFSASGMPKIFHTLYMDSEPDLAPPKPYWEWIVENVKAFSEAGDTMLDRHSDVLEPSVRSYIHQLTKCSCNMLLSRIPVQVQSDSEREYPRIRILYCYSEPPGNKDFEAILGLFSWCETQYAKIKKIKPDISRVAQYRPMRDKKHPPKCLIPEHVLKEQTDEFNRFQDGFDSNSKTW